MSSKRVYQNGNIVTMDERHPIASNMVVEGEVITGLDLTPEEISSQSGEIIDLQEKTVLPGFNDSHAHMVSYGMSLEMLYLNDATSIRELQAMVKDYIEKNNVEEGKWVLGRGWDDTKFAENRDLCKEDLDEISTRHPIVLGRTCGHLRALNTNALQRCKIDKSTQVKGGRIDLDRDGEPVGLVGEEAKEIIFEAIPPYSVEDYKRFIVNGANKYREAGLTSVQSDDFEASGEPFKNVMQAYIELAQNRELPIKVNLQLQLRTIEKIEELLSAYPVRSYTEFFSMGPLKIVPDGSLGAKTAALRKPYLGDPHNFGLLLFSPFDLEELIDYAYGRSLQVACHAIGDRTIEVFLDIIERMKEKYERTSRPRIIHCQLTDIDLIKRMRTLNVIADAQQSFVASDWRIAEERLGKERCVNTYAWKTMQENGIVVSGGSDSPVETYNPFRGIEVAVTREDDEGNPKGGWMPHEKVTVHDAIKMYTLNSAYSCYEEHKKGMLAPNYRADFIVLKDNPFLVHPSNLEEMEVESSTIEGATENYG